MMSGPPVATVFNDDAVLDLLATMVGGENLSIKVERGGLEALVPAIVVDGFVTTGDPTCVPAPNVVSHQVVDLNSKRTALEEGIAYLRSISRGAQLRYFPETSDLRPFLENGFHLSHTYTSLIDLSLPESSLLRGMRKSYASAIRKTEREYRTASAAHDDLSLFEHWFDLYRIVLARGGKRPSDASEQHQRRMFRSGTLRLFAVPGDGYLIAGVVICVVDDYAYYWQSATHPKYDRQGAFSHLLLWVAIRSLRAAGVRHLEAGPIAADKGADEKQNAISFFKLGLGGRVVPWWILSASW